jgi:hypothetical protein
MDGMEDGVLFFATLHGDGGTILKNRTLLGPVGEKSRPLRNFASLFMHHRASPFYSKVDGLL